MLQDILLTSIKLSTLGSFPLMNNDLFAKVNTRGSMQLYINS